MGFNQGGWLKIAPFLPCGSFFAVRFIPMLGGLFKFLPCGGFYNCSCKPMLGEAFYAAVAASGTAGSGKVPAQSAARTRRHKAGTKAKGDTQGAEPLRFHP